MVVDLIYRRCFSYDVVGKDVCFVKVRVIYVEYVQVIMNEVENF